MVVLALQGLDGSFTSLTRIRSISNDGPSASGPHAGVSANLKNMPSIDGLSIMRSDSMWEGAGLVRVLSCVDTSSCRGQLMSHPSIVGECIVEGVEEAAEHDARPSTKRGIEDHHHDDVVVSVEHDSVNSQEMQ